MGTTPAGPGPGGPRAGRWADAARALADLVLPRACAGCAVPGPVLCPRCSALLARPHLAQPRRHPPGFPPTVAAGAYAGPVRPAVVAFKEHGRAELAGPLGSALGLAVAAVLTGLAQPPAPGTPVVLVPVPSSAAAVRARGRDHVRELADRAVAELRAAGVPAAAVPLLRRPRGTADSAGLGARERQANLAGRFALRRRPAPSGVLVVVDDVVTSGATLTEAARALRAGSGHAPPARAPVLAAVVAATPRRTSGQATAPPPGAFTVRS
ncbi:MULTISPECIES: ComF family protein [unclassified Modestobacter]